MVRKRLTKEREEGIRKRLATAPDWYCTIGAYDIAALLGEVEALQAERDVAVNKLNGWETAPTWVAVPVLKKRAEHAECWAKMWKAAAKREKADDPKYLAWKEEWLSKRRVLYKELLQAKAGGQPDLIAAAQKALDKHEKGGKWA